MANRVEAAVGHEGRAHTCAKDQIVAERVEAAAGLERARLRRRLIRFRPRDVLLNLTTSRGQCALGLREQSHDVLWARWLPEPVARVPQQVANVLHHASVFKRSRHSSKFAKPSESESLFGLARHGRAAGASEAAGPRVPAATAPGRRGSACGRGRAAAARR